MDEPIELMEKKILEIMDECIFDLDDGNNGAENAAKEITAHVKRFIKWKDNQDTIKIYDDPDVYINLDGNKLMSLDEVFQCWCDIKLKT